MSSKRRTISVADKPVKDAFRELEEFEGDNPIGQGTERRKELRGNVLATLGLSPALVEKDRVNRAFDTLYRECRHPSGDAMKQRSKVAKVARDQTRHQRKKDAVTALVALSGK